MSHEQSKSESSEAFPNSKKVYVSGELNKDVRVPFREISLQDTQTFNGQTEVNEALRVYDTSGPWGDDSQSCDVNSGLFPLRRDWILARQDVEAYERREIQPQDDGYLTKGHEALARTREKEKGGLERFAGSRPKPLRSKAGQPVTQMYYARRGIVTPEMEFIAIRENLGREKAYEAISGDYKTRSLLNHQHPGESFGSFIHDTLHPNLFETKSREDVLSSRRTSIILKASR